MIRSEDLIVVMRSLGTYPTVDDIKEYHKQYDHGKDTIHIVGKIYVLCRSQQNKCRLCSVQSSLSNWRVLLTVHLSPLPISYKHNINIIAWWKNTSRILSNIFPNVFLLFLLFKLFF